MQPGEAPRRSHTSLGRVVFLAMIPVNILMIPWIWFGRALFDSMGWFLVILLYAIPFVALALLVTTVLAFVRLDKPRELTLTQAKVQLTVWAAGLGLGFFLVDFGDTEDSITSAFTQVVGTSETLLGLSGVLSALCALVAIATWLVLLVLLLRDPSATSVPDRSPSDGMTSDLP